MQKIQRETLQCEPVEDDAASDNTMRLPDKGPTVRWHGDLASVPHGPCLVIAQELFDALPVHQFEYTDRCVYPFVSCPSAEEAVVVRADVYDAVLSTVLGPYVAEAGANALWTSTLKTAMTTFASCCRLGQHQPRECTLAARNCLTRRLLYRP